VRVQQRRRSLSDSSVYLGPKTAWALTIHHV
jgi:hypothetical protein